MKRTYQEIMSSFLGWIIYLTSYLALAITTVTVVQAFKEGINPWLGFLIFIKWEVFIIVFSFALANVINFWQVFVQKFIVFGGLLRVFIIIILSYLIASALLPYALIPFGFAASVSVDEIESALTFIMMILIIFRVYPQKYYDNPKGPLYELPVEEKYGVIPFGLFHPGFDFIQSRGTPIYAVEDGKVAIAWPYSIYGNMVKISHDSSWSTVYGHLSKLNVKYGEQVKKGDLIGYVGSTGYAFHPHLHFEVRYKNRVVDPKEYLKGLAEEKKTTEKKPVKKVKGKQK